MARTVNVGADALSNGSFDPAPAGTKVKATIWEISEVTVKKQDSENFGKEQAVVTVKITEDFRFTVDGKQQNLKGREVRYNNVPFYAGKSGWQLAAFGQAVDWPVDEEGNVQIPEKEELAPQTQGKEVVVQLGIRTGQDGRKFQTVSRWLPATSKTSGGEASGGATSGGSEPVKWA